MEELSLAISDHKLQHKDFEEKMKKQLETFHFIKNYDNSKLTSKNAHRYPSEDRSSDKFAEKTAYHSVDSYLEQIQNSFEKEQRLSKLDSISNNLLNEGKTQIFA